MEMMQSRNLRPDHPPGPSDERAYVCFIPRIYGDLFLLKDGIDVESDSLLSIAVGFSVCILDEAAELVLTRQEVDSALPQPHSRRNPGLRASHFRQETDAAEACPSRDGCPLETQDRNVPDSRDSPGSRRHVPRLEGRRT